VKKDLMKLIVKKIKEVPKMTLCLPEAELCSWSLCIASAMGILVW
jgi:hypothetical protein